VRLAALLVLGVGAALSVAETAAAAPSPADKATAQALFDDALQRMSAGKFADACPKLEESERLDAAMGTSFQLARCYEGMGRLASAWAMYIQVADLARASGQASREKAARDAAAALEPRLSYLTVAVEMHPEGLVVRRGDVTVPAPQWGTRIPVDAGTYHFTASAPGRVSWSGEVSVGERGAVTARIPDLAIAPVAPHASVVPAAAAVAPKPPPSDAQRIAGIVTLSVGAAGIVTSGVLGLIAKSNYNAANGECPAAGCTGPGEAATNSARSLGDGATVVFVVGAVAAATGAVVWATAPRATTAPSARLRLCPAGLAFTGEF
jgi:serine/threonine-protein kinase